MLKVSDASGGAEDKTLPGEAPVKSAKDVVLIGVASEIPLSSHVGVEDDSGETAFLLLDSLVVTPWLLSLNAMAGMLSVVLGILVFLFCFACSLFLCKLITGISDCNEQGLIT